MEAAIDKTEVRGWKRYPSYKSLPIEWFPQAPEHWEAKRLKNVVTFQRGHDLPSDERVAGDIPIITSAGPSAFHNVAVATAPGIVTERYGTIGTFHLVESDYWPLNTTLYSTNLHGNFPRFTQYMLQILRPIFLLNAAKSAVPGVDRNDLHPLPVAIPSDIEEQQAIANFLDRETARIDALIGHKERLIALLEEKRQAVISHAVTRGLDPNAKMNDSGLSWPTSMPDHWEPMRIKYLLSEIIDAEHKTAPFYEGADYFVVRTSNVRNGKLLYSSAKYTDAKGYAEWTERGIPEPGDILFTREAPAGEACLVPPTGQLCLGQRMVLFKVLKDRLDSRFAIWSLYSGVSRSFIEELSQGSTVHHFNMADIKNIPLLLPPLTEQTEIADFLEDQTQRFDNLRTKVEQGIERLQEYRTALISAAVTGQIDVREEVAASDG